MLNSPKILSLTAAARLRRRLRAAGRKVVLTNGVFDLLHTGHTSYLAAARRLGGPKGKLFVALNSDRSVRALKGKFRPILPEKGPHRLPSWAFNMQHLAEHHNHMRQSCQFEFSSIVFRKAHMHKVQCLERNT